MFLCIAPAVTTQLAEHDTHFEWFGVVRECDCGSVEAGKIVKWWSDLIGKLNLHKSLVRKLVFYHDRIRLDFLFGPLIDFNVTPI